MLDGLVQGHSLQTGGAQTKSVFLSGRKERVAFGEAATLFTAPPALLQVRRARPRRVRAVASWGVNGREAAGHVPIEDILPDSILSCKPGKTAE